MVTQYFFAHGEAEHGPYSAVEMQELAAAGKIERADLVWRQGIGRPIPAARVKLLFPVGPDTPTETVAVAAAPPAADAKQEAAADDAFVKPAEQKPAKVAKPERPRRVVSIKGGILVGQDGRQVFFRKKCTTCGTEEQCRTTAVIKPGMMTVPYFCRKCRKGRTVELLGIS
jgi:GYF domain 2